MKNGLRSSKNISYPSRRTAPGSASTCPKSGLIVKSRIKSRVTDTLPSMPAEILFLDPSTNGLPSSLSNRSVCASTYGANSICLLVGNPVKPCNSPKWLTHPLELCGTYCHDERSSFLKYLRITCMPHVGFD